MKLRNRLVRPCKYIILRILKLRFRKRLFIKFQRRKQATQDKDSPRRSTKKIVSFESVLRLLRIKKKTRDIEHMDRMMELKSLSAAAVAVQNEEKSGIRTKSKISTLSTNYVNAGSENGENSSQRTTGKTTSSTNVGRNEGSEEVEEACRSFENYLVEMITEEGRIKDLMDVEQLLYCWNNLRCPVFIGLVSTFYGELCKDLFSNN
ncbi:transcription repressor OFP17-like [Heracleum sosnowskyi]|uniref:Transcription repressor OFP17-like n=1 Tax=Heracleum sosnowskyi TaxID=360622 RepID=A0AAD8GMZ4_9APIA|nr:transcription repressor OFP17-like [Heracleum sosnowskyi]